MGQVLHEMAGGPKPGRKIKAVHSGGSSAKFLREGDRFKLKDREVSLEKSRWIRLPRRGRLDGRLRRGDRNGRFASMVWALNNINEFTRTRAAAMHACREGALWMKENTQRMLDGGCVTRDPATLKTWLETRRPHHPRLGEACAWPPKVPRQSLTNSRPAHKSGPPSLPPEYTPEN